MTKAVRVLWVLAAAALLLSAKCRVNPQDVCRYAPELCPPSPSPSPSVTPEPHPSPSATAEPSPSPSPSLPPSPVPEPSSIPPSPEPLPCVDVVPSGMVKVQRDVCPKGWPEVAWSGKRLCFAPSSIPEGGQDPVTGCLSCSGKAEFNLAGGYYVVQDGLLLNPHTGVWQDAYCRQSKDGQTVLFDWSRAGVCPPRTCTEPKPEPSPTVQPSTAPGCKAGESDVVKLGLFHYAGKEPGHPFEVQPGVEALITATPKAGTDCGGKACDARCHGRDLTWTAVRSGHQWTIPDEGEVDIGCAIVAAGPVELTFNRRIKGTSSCEFDLTAVLVDPAGKRWTETKRVTVR